MGEEKRINIIADKKAINSYTYGWLNYMAEWSGLDKEDVELVSICDINDLHLLMKPKTRPIRVIGGPESFNDNFYQMFGDALAIGEGWEFFRDFKKFGSLEKVFEQPYMCTPDKTEVISSTHINWQQAPPMKVGQRKVMILGSRGCKNKCKFCYASWTTKHQVAPEIKFNQKGLSVNIITNDSEGSTTQKTQVRSITVKKYLSMTEAEAKLCRFYRFGLESFTEKGRLAFAKPIKNESLRAVAAIAKKYNHDIQFFVIAGIEPQESLLEFLDAIGTDISKKPRIFIKGTYFNPCLHTPLQGYDISKLHNWDVDWIYGQLTSHSGRFRTTMALDAGNGLYRGLIRRARNMDEVKILYPCRAKKRAEVEAIVAKNNLEALYLEVPPTKIKFAWR